MQKSMLLKEAIQYFILLVLLLPMLSCENVIVKNKKQIEGILNAHATTKSLKITHYDILNYQDDSDTLHVFVNGKYANNLSFTDTVIIAKHPLADN